MSEQPKKAKFKEAVLFLVQNCNNKYLGVTKLNKLLYYLDFISYRDRGVTVTGDIYIHKDYGPVPETVDEIISDLKQQKRLSTEVADYKEGYKFKLKALSEPNLEEFEKYEKTLLEKICKEFLLWSTDKIVSQTHLEAPWFYSKPYDIVDFKYSNDIEFFPIR